MHVIILVIFVKWLFIVLSCTDWFIHCLLRNQKYILINLILSCVNLTSISGLDQLLFPALADLSIMKEYKWLAYQLHKTWLNIDWLRNLIYRVEQIRQVDILKLAILFILVHLKGTHPSVYEALSPALMDGNVTLEAFKCHMHHFYELLAMHNPDNLAFPSLSPTNSTFARVEFSLLTIIPTLALPALLPPWANICPNCKKPGHLIKFCISPGGKMHGQLALDTVAAQHAIHKAACTCTNPTSTPSSTNSLIKIDNDGTVWIYNPHQQLNQQGQHLWTRTWKPPWLLLIMENTWTGLTPTLIQTGQSI